MELEEVYIEEQQQPDPPTKKRALYDAVSKKYDLGTYEDFERKLNDPTKRKSLYDYIGKEFELGTYQEFENKLNDNVKKKEPSGNGSKEPVVGESVSTTSTTQEPIPTVMLVNGEAIPSKDAIALSLSASKLKNAKKEIEVPSINKAGYTLEQVPDEEKLKDYENTKSEIKKLGYDADELVEEFSDFPQDAFRNPSTTKEVLLDLRKNNLVKYHQLLNETKNRYAIRQAAAKKTYDNLPSDTPHGDEIITNNAVIAGNAYVEDGVVNDVNELQNSIRKKQYLINTNLTGEERDKANQRLKDTYSNEFNRNTRFLQDDYTQSPFKSILDIDQYAALKGIEVLDPSNYEQIVNQLNVELQPEYRLNIPMSGFQAPVAASPSITTTDSNMVKKYGGSETGESIDKRTGKEGVLKMLLDIGRNNALTNIKKNEDDLVSKFNNSTDYNEKTELKLLYDKLMTEKQSILESKNMDKQRFPLISKLEFNQQVKDMVNDTDMSAGGYYLNRFLTNIASTQHGTDNFLINIFGSDKQKAEQRLKTSGYSAWKQGLLYLPESLSKEQSPVEIQVSDDLRKKVKEITGGSKIEDWTQTQKEAVNKLVADNQREIKYITNTKENDKNFISKATGYSMAGFLGDISALFYQMAGGKALGGKSAEMMVMGLSGYENGYETGIGEGLSDDESHDKGIMEGMINMVAAKYGSRLDYAKKMAAIENPSLSKALNNISDDVWNKVVSKNQTIISRIKKTAASVVPENAKQIAVWGGFVPAANMIAEDIFSDKDYTAKEIFNQTAKSLKHMAIDQLAIAPLGIVRGLTKKPFSFYDKSMLWEIGSDAETTKMQISEDIANNVITKEVGDARLKAVDNVSKLINKVPIENDNGNKLSDKERINYLYNIFIADKANEAQKSLPPKQAEKADHKAKVAEYSNQILLDQATPEKLQKRKEQLEKSLEPKKDAEGKTIEIPEKELAQYKAELEAVNDAIETREKWVTVEKGNLTGESIPLKTKEDKPNNAYTDQYNKALENPDQREQALQEISDQWHDPRSRKLIEESIAPEIIKEAKEKYPKEETTTKVEQPTVSETEGKSDVVDKASNGGGDVVIEKKNTGTEIEPDLGEGRKPVTLSGSTEAERQVAIEQRKKETKQTPMTSERDALLERIQKFNKLSRSQKRASYGEVNKIKVALDKFNKGNEQQHSITTNRDGSLDLRGNPTDKRPSGKPIRYTLKGNENSIIDNAVTLTERDLKTKEVFKELLDADVLPVSRRINGEKMSEAEHDATIQDILDGIPSQRAENYLNSLEKQIREDNFDFGNPDKNIRTTLNDALGITTERGEPMTADAVEKWLKDESELTKEDEILFDNIENLITHYEQLHESESGTPAKIQQPIGKGQESNSGKANENEQPKSETSTANKKEPIKNEEAQVTQDTNQKEKTNIADKGTTEDGKEAGEPFVEGKRTILSHRGLQEVATEFGFGDVTSRELKTDPQLFKDAQNKVDGWVEKGEYPQQITKLVEKAENAEVLTDEQRVILQQHIANVRGEMEAMDINTPDYNKKLTELNRLIRAGEATRSAAGAALRVPFMASVPNDLPTMLVEEMNISRVPELTERQKATVQKEHKGISEAEKVYQEKIAGLEAQLAKQRADRKVKETKQATQKSKKTKEDFAKEREDIKKSILAKWNNAKNVGISADPKNDLLVQLAPDVVKLVKSYVEEGVIKLEEVTKKIYDELKGTIQGLSEKDIHNIIAGDYNKKLPTKNQLAEQVENIRIEANLINKLEALMRGEEPKNEKKKIQRNAAIEELRQKIKSFGKEEKTPDQKSLDAVKTKLKNEAEKIKEQIRTGNFDKEPPKQPLKLDAEALKLRDEVIRLRQNREVRLLLAKRINEKPKEKGMRLAAEVLNIPRTLMTIGDYSALLRQNIFFTAGHPVMSSRASKEMFKAGWSQKEYDRWFADYKESPRYHIKEKSRLAISDSLSHDLTKREEVFMSSLSEKIPLIGKTIVKGSERSYTALLNKIRSDMFDYFADSMEARGLTYENSPKQYDAMAEYINNATGRSDFGETLNRVAPILNSVFFSPRLIASRVNMLSYWMQPRFWTTLPKEVRVDYMRNWVSLLAMGGTIMALAQMGGAEVEDDPRSSDFGKIKSGNTRWDIWGGAQPYVRVMSQVISGQRKSTKSGKIYDLNGDDIFGETRAGVASDFFRNKLAPVPGAMVDILSGRTGVGDKIVYQWGGADKKEISIDDYVKQRLLPMTVTGTEEAMKDMGVKALLTVTVPNVFGVGTQVYGGDDSASKKEKKPSKPTKPKKQQ